MKKYLIVLILLTVAEKALSQTVFPLFSDSAHWSVLRAFCGFGCSSSTDHYFYEKDTVICNQTYSKLDDSSRFSAYIRVDNRKVYCKTIPTCSSREYLIYDYNMNVGDSVYTGFYLSGLPDTVPFRLDSISTRLFNGISRNIYHMSYSENRSFPLLQQMDWAEGIGSLNHPFYSLDCFFNGCEIFYNLLCYDSSSVNLYLDSILNTCDTTFTLSINETDASKAVSIYSNPFTDEINVLFENNSIEELILYDIAGKIQKSITVTANTNTALLNKLNELPSGIYFMKVKLKDGDVTRILLKE